MVWIYGGAYSAGYSNTSLYGPDFFLEEDVVFVSFNYRLGALGFLSLGHPDALGNAGLKDQRLVLQWVQENIAAFGGDPRQVTIFGESAGAASVGFHMLSERSIGLFHRSISMSGTPLCQWAYHTPADAYRSAVELAGLLGKVEITKTDLLQLLRDAPADALVNLAMKVNLNAPLPFRPTIEDSAVATDGSAFITECPIRKYLSGNFTQHPMMMGRTHDEALFFLDDYVGSPSNHARSMAKWLQQVTNIDGILTAQISDVMSVNFDQVPPELVEQVLALLTDTFFTAPIDLTQRIVSSWNLDHPIYYYRLSYRSKYSVHSLVGQTVKGTSHVDDIGDLFNVVSLNAPTDPKHPFNVFRRKMVKLWTNFAKHGNPTPKVTSRRAGEEFDVTWTDSTESGTQLDIKAESCLGNQYPRTEVVQTTTGPVRGIVKQTVWHNITYNAFLGIPYAVPPLGRLRFKSPVPIKPWTETYEANEQGAVCPQVDFFSGDYMGVEDCLTVNVLTRQVRLFFDVFDSARKTNDKRRYGQVGKGKSSQLKPVLLWIYGGAFFAGFSNVSLYGPDFFLEDDVVFASFNYRVGAPGFLALDHPDAQGNAAMKDQLLAMQWVQKNIAAFGGDPNQITLFGESAGATSVGLHMLSEKSKGLFKQVIMQSGTPLTQWGFHTPNKAYENARSLAVKLGYNGIDSDGLLKFLRRVPIKEMVTKTLQLDFGFLPFRPTIENPKISVDDSSFLTECPIQLLKSGRYTKVPIMMGRNKDESLFFLNFMVGKDEEHAQAIASLLRNAMGVNKIVDQVLGTMSGAVFDMMPDSLIKLYLDIGTATMFTAPIDLTQKILAKTNDGLPIYYYMLSHQAEWNIHSLVGDSVNGTAHVDDIGYLFNVEPLNAPTDPKHPFNVVRKKMVTLWTNFAKYGNPTPPKAKNDGPVFNVVWPDSTATGAQLEINEDAVVKDRIVDALTLTYEDGLEKRLGTETACDWSVEATTKSSNFFSLFFK
ncbi:LOW QUALITY PROTEIN: acetylcholinesterase-like [Augochlora pura]